MSIDWVKLGDVVEVIRGASPRPKGDPRYFGGNIPWVMISDITKEPGKYLSKTRDGVTPAGADKSRLLSAETLILSNSGTVCVPKILAVEGCIHDGFVAFPNLPPSIDKIYLYHYFNFIRPRIIQENKQGITQVNLNTGIVKDIDFPLRPIEEQRLVVAEIEKQLSRLDEAVASLKRIQANLKRYKAAVLKAAVEGKLTKQWRKDHPNVEPADQLLKRILTERHAKWEAEELAKMKAKGIKPKDDSWKKKYKEPAGPDTANLPELPVGWVWASVEQLTTELMNGFGKRSQNDGDPTIVLRLADIQNGEVSYADVRRINCTVEDIDKYGLQQQDLVILRVNGSPDLVGRFVLVRQVPENALFCDHFIRARCTGSAQALWLRVYSDTRRFRRYVELNKVSSAGQNTINQGVLSIFEVPLPSSPEQQQIIPEINRRLSVTEELEATIETNLKRASNLRQQILRTAFSLD